MKVFSGERWDGGFEARLLRSHVGPESTSPPSQYWFTFAVKRVLIERYSVNSH